MQMVVSVAHLLLVEPEAELIWLAEVRVVEAITQTNHLPLIFLVVMLMGVMPPAAAVQVGILAMAEMVALQTGAINRE
jgi:hypothetical protein